MGASKNLIRRSGQTWKAVVGELSAFAGLATMAFGLRHGEQTYGVVCTVAGLGVGCLAIVGTFLFVRCPTCGMRWVWAAVKNERHDRWMLWLTRLQSCPGCEKRREDAGNVPASVRGTAGTHVERRRISLCAHTLHG